MPTLRRPTKEELDELSRQGVDISTLPDELPWYSPEEMTQIRAKEAAGGGAASAVGSTLKAHAGSYAGGALATAGAARLLSAVPHPLVKLPALAISALLGSVAGQKAQEIVMPETQGQWENEAEAYRTRFPKTTMATDVLAGAIVGGGKPNLRAPLYTVKGINQMLKVGLANVERPYAEAMANTLTGNAINTGLYAGLQLATRGEIDPLGLAGSAAAGAIFTDPSALGKRIMPEWKPISRMPKKPVAKLAIKYVLLDKNISSPMEVEQVIANRNKQKAIDDEAAASEAAWQAKAAEIEALNNRIIEEETAKRAAALKNFRENDIRDKKRFSDSLIRRLFLKEYMQKVPKGADAITKASIEATNAQLRELSADTMRQHLWEKYAAQYDPETYNAHMQQKAAAEAKKAALVEQWKAQNADQNAKLAEQAAQEKQAKEFAKLHKKLIDETQAAEAERVRVAEATRKRQIDEMWKAYEAEQQEALRQKVNAEALAKEIAGGAVARPKTPVEQPFAFRRGLKQVTGKGDAADQAQADYDKSQGAKYQPLNEEGTPALEGESADAINERTASVRGKDTPEFLGEAAKQGIKVGRTEDELVAPGVGRVRGVSYDPNSLGERLVLLDKMSTSDTGYHELLHSVLRDMRRSGDERLAKLADRIAAVGEERQVQAGGETYRDVVEGKKSILGKVGRWLDEVVANAKVKMGSDDPETLRRHLVAIARNTVSPETSPRIRGAMRYKGTGNAPRFTDNQNQPLAEGDYERYNELQARFKQLVQEGNTDGDELMKVWAESEAIKNKIEGRTPTAEDKFQPLEEGKRRVSGANIARSMKIFGAGMYDKQPTRTTVKELVQNSFDAVEEAENPVIHLTSDDLHERVIMSDNGKGMSPEQVVTKFLTAYESDKKSETSAGGYGLAKIAFLGGSQEFNVETISDVNGVRLRTMVEGTGEGWLRFVQEGAELPNNINKPGTYELNDGLAIDVTEAPNAKLGTMVNIMPKEYNGYEGRSAFNDIARYAPSNIKFNLDFVNDGGQTIPMNVRRDAHLHKAMKEADVSGARVKITYDPSSKLENQYYIPVTNNGLKQFDLMNNADVKLPKLIIEVTPKVSVDSESYPYSTNRDSLKGAAKVFVDQTIKEISNTYKQEQLGKFNRTMANKSRIGTSNQVFLDLSGVMTPEQRVAIANHPIVTSLNNVLRRAHKNIFDVLNKRYMGEQGKYWKNVTFEGFANGGQFQGVRFGVPARGAEGNIYYDLDEIFAAARMRMDAGAYTPEEAPTAFAEELAGVVLHEVAHQISFHEGETHAIAMTELAGRVAHQLSSLVKKVTDVYETPDSFFEFKDWYKDATRGAKLDYDESRNILREGQSKKEQGQQDTQIFGGTRAGTDEGGDVKYQPLEEDESNRPYTRIGAYRDKNQRLHSAYYDENAAYDAVDKLRREHPESKAVVIPAGQRFEVHVIDKGDDTKYQPLDYDNTERRFNILRPEIKRVSDISKPLGEGFTKFYEKFRELKGTLTNDVVGKLRGYIDFFNPKELYTQDNADMQAVVQRRLDMQYEGKTDIKLTPRQQEIDKIVQDNLDKSRELTNTYPKLPREVEKIENYLPRVVSHEALNTLLNTTPDNPKRQQLIADFYDYYRSLHAQKSGETREEWLTRVHEEADKELRNFLGGHSKERIDLAQQFGPIDKARGVGLPRSWIETNLIDVMSRFNNRYARRLAYHEAIEQHPELYSLMKDPIMGIGSNAAVRNVYDDISGHLEFNEAKRQAAAGLVRAAMLGPLTGAKDFVSNLVLGFQHQTPGQAVKSAIDSWSNIKENLAESFEAGVNRHNFGSLEWGEGDANNIINVLRRTRDVINQVQGRNLLEQMTRATAFGQGKFLAMDNLYAAKNNSLSGQGRKFLKDFAPGWEKYVDAGEFPKEELARVAARYVESVQGTYDYRGLPAIAQKGTLAPYLSLARWNIEKFNNFLKYVVEPAKEGNITPLLMSTLGMVIGGAAVTKLVEMATNKKEKTPKLAELSAASEQGADITKATAWKLASMASAAGYAGILGDITKSLLDKAHGNKAQVYDNPLIIGLSAIGSNAWDVVEAAQSGDLNLTADALSNFLEDTTQAYRVTLNQVSGEKRKQIAKTDKMRDYRVYRQIRGEQVPNSSIDQPNPYIGADIRDYKNSESIEEAAKLLPSLISRAFEKADGDIEKLRLELAKLKAHNYQTMPSPATMPLSFLRYVNYLRLSQGDQVAQERVADYMRRNAIDKAKTRMIP